MIATIAEKKVQRSQRSYGNHYPAITAIAATAKLPGCIAYALVQIEKAIDLALFMEEVQKNDCLYNKLFFKGTRRKHRKINCWKAIGVQFD